MWQLVGKLLYNGFYSCWKESYFRNDVYDDAGDVCVETDHSSSRVVGCVVCHMQSCIIAQ